MLDIYSILPLRCEVRINTVRDSVYHCRLIRGIRHIQIIMLIGHESHFEQDARDRAPVVAGHVILFEHAAVTDAGGTAVGIDDTSAESCRPAPLTDELSSPSK